jgi:hypothetical protein
MQRLMHMDATAGFRLPRQKYALKHHAEALAVLLPLRFHPHESVRTCGCFAFAPIAPHWLTTTPHSATRNKGAIA